MALAVFMAAAFSDFADGVIARHYRLVSEFGARLDPIADKFTMLTATVLLAWQGWLPLWLAAAIVLRDVVIAGGAIAYRLVVGHVEMGRPGSPRSTPRWNSPRSRAYSRTPRRSSTGATGSSRCSFLFV